MRQRARVARHQVERLAIGRLGPGRVPRRVAHQPEQIVRLRVRPVPAQMRLGQFRRRRELAAIRPARRLGQRRLPRLGRRSGQGDPHVRERHPRGRKKRRER